MRAVHERRVRRTTDPRQRDDRRLDEREQRRPDLVEADLVVSEQTTSIGEVAVPVVVVDLEGETTPERVGRGDDHERDQRAIDGASRPTGGAAVTTARRLGGR